MITKLGVDLVYIPRFEKLMQDKAFIEKVFLKSEISDCRPEHLAGLFAAKEAFFKAANKIGVKPKWLEIEIKTQKKGSPILIMSNECDHSLP